VTTPGVPPCPNSAAVRTAAPGRRRTAEEWYSDEALRKQSEVKRLTDAGEQPPLSLLLGIIEPRVPAATHERCAHCGGDGRDQAGGGESKGVRWCSLCLDRDRDEDYEPTGGARPTP
jgi:hypothetical protein